MSYDTSLNILNDALVELGLKSANVTNPYASTDQNVLLLVRLLKGLGQDLVREAPWTHLLKTHTFNTVNGTESYALPADFSRAVPNTSWNRDETVPLFGPMSPSQWQALKAQASSAVADKVFRVYQDLVWVFPTPTAVDTLAYEYVSTYWVKPSGQSAPTAETTTLVTDTLHFPRRLLIAGLKVRFLETKGFDATLAAKAYDREFAKALGQDGGAPVLSLTQNALPSRLLDGANSPETGFGS